MDDEHIEARKKANLEPYYVDHNPDKLVDPTIKWIDKPETYAKSLLHEKRKMDNLKD